MLRHASLVVVVAVGVALLPWPAALGVVFYCALLARQNWQRAAEPAVVWSWLPFIGSAVVFGQRPLEWLRECATSHGATFVATIAGQRTVFVTDPDAWSAIFRERDALDFASIAVGVVRDAFGVTQRDTDAWSKPEIIGQTPKMFLRCLMADGSYIQRALGVFLSRERTKTRSLIWRRYASRRGEHIQAECADALLGWGDRFGAGRGVARRDRRVAALRHALAGYFHGDDEGYHRGRVCDA